ncbi:hypothetical protein KXR83_26460 [Williamsia muralis]|uniref:hypothetical protein n=1 Tax=Williamsia marianensis TaxID=85044 RepID=UPI003F15DA29
MNTTRAIQAFALLACALLCAAATMAAIYIHQLEPAASVSQEQQQPIVCAYELAYAPAVGELCDLYAPPPLAEFKP